MTVPIRYSFDTSSLLNGRLELTGEPARPRTHPSGGDGWVREQVRVA